jgi:hypothetical protein
MQRQQQLARIDAAQWRDLGYGSHALVAQDDSEALVLLMRRHHGNCSGDSVWVVDASDRCYVGLENAKTSSVRDLKESVWESA